MNLCWSRVLGFTNKPNSSTVILSPTT